MSAEMWQGKQLLRNRHVQMILFAAGICSFYLIIFSSPTTISKTADPSLRVAVIEQTPWHDGEYLLGLADHQRSLGVFLRRYIIAESSLHYIVRQHTAALTLGDWLSWDFDKVLSEIYPTKPIPRLQVIGALERGEIDLLIMITGES